MLFYISILIIFAFSFTIIQRTKKYGYKQSDDYIYNLNDAFIADIEIKERKLILDNIKKYDTLFLKMELKRTLVSYVFKPYIMTEDKKHFFEYGAEGIRYLNISHLKSNTTKLQIYHIKLKTTKAKLYGYENNINLSDNILILAPHADDAEIASFGLYKTAKNITIVTTTIGEHGVCNYCDIYNDDRLKSSLKKAELRTFDALNIPFLGGVNIKHSLTLGYFGGKLTWMRENPNKEVYSKVKGFSSFDKFRKVSHSHIKLKNHQSLNYNTFLDDLREIITQVQPKLIITPHPQIDSHQDHKQTTLSTIEILKELNYKTKLLLYTNHLSQSQTYPLGEIGTAITLPPNKKEFYFNAVYSFCLDDNLQKDKFFALEAMHDLRNPQINISIKHSLKHLNKLIRRKLSTKDKSYYRRSIRANELFFVVDDFKEF